jgi:hypothetical protein
LLFYLANTPATLSKPPPRRIIKDNRSYLLIGIIPFRERASPLLPPTA